MGVRQSQTWKPKTLPMVRFSSAFSIGSNQATAFDLVPRDVVRELTFTGRIVPGTEAKELGLVTKLSEDPLADAMATAKLIATKSPHAIRAGKALLRDAPGMSRADALKLETALQVTLLGSTNQMEAVQANMMKRDPEFKDPE